MNDNDEFILFWQLNEEPGFNNIYFQRYDKFGNQTGEPVKVGKATNKNIDRADHTQPYFDMAINNTGNFVLSWEYNDSIKLKFYDVVNNQESPEVEIIKSLYDRWSVAINNNDKFVISWQEPVNEVLFKGYQEYKSKLYAQIYNKDGKIETEKFEIGPSSHEAKLSPKLFIDDNSLYVTWIDRYQVMVKDINGTHPVYPCDLYFQKYNFSGNSVIDALKIHNVEESNGTPQYNFFKGKDNFLLTYQLDAKSYLTSVDNYGKFVNPALEFDVNKIYQLSNELTNSDYMINISYTVFKKYNPLTNEISSLQTFSGLNERLGSDLIIKTNSKNNIIMLGIKKQYEVVKELYVQRFNNHFYSL